MDGMIPVLSSAEMKTADERTIGSQKISSLDLMERASSALYRALKKKLAPTMKILVVCGPGNNGGDGLCIARMLLSEGYSCKILLLESEKRTVENQTNYDMIGMFKPGSVLNSGTVFKDTFDVIIDCIFGTGLSHTPAGIFADVIEQINKSDAAIYSVDCPSGLFDIAPAAEDKYIHASHTYAIETPKLSFFYPENKISFSIVRAGIEIQKDADFYFLSPQQPYKDRIIRSLPVKPVFGSKFDSGHVLLAGGNKGMHGALAMAAASSVFHGAGLTTALGHPGAGFYFGQLPEVMFISKKIQAQTAEKAYLNRYSVLAIGPGLGRTQDSREFLETMLRKWNKSVLLDADALYWLAEDPGLWELVPSGSIITPHSGEFARLFGETNNGETFLEKGREKARQHNIYILAKSKYSALFCADGRVIFNGTGGPELSQGGSGDRLSGAISAWWARTANAETACIAGMYLQGLGITV